MCYGKWDTDLNIRSKKKKTDQSSEYRAKGELKPKKPRQSCSKIGEALPVFFDYLSGVHCEYLSPSETVNNKYYLTLRITSKATE